MKQISLDELVSMFDPEVRAALESLSSRFPSATHVVVFENQQMDSSQLGMRSAYPIGPDNTFKSLDAVRGKWLNDLPSQRQYAAYFWPIER